MLSFSQLGNLKGAGNHLQANLPGIFYYCNFQAESANMYGRTFGRSVYNQESYCRRQRQPDSLVRRVLKPEWFRVNFIAGMHADIAQQAQGQAGAEQTGSAVAHQRQSHPGDGHQADRHSGIDDRL